MGPQTYPARPVRVRNRGNTSNSPRMITCSVAKLRQVDVLVSQGQNMGDTIRQMGVSEVTYYRWRQEFGGLKTEQV